MSKQKLNLLILENNPDDAELIVRELEKEGFVLEWERVDTEKEFKKALAKNPEIILADYKLPSYNGIAAIKLQRKTAPDIPLIIVSGTIGDELAVECLKAGATDYVLKNRLSRLSLVVKRALKETEERSELKQAEEVLRKSEEKYQLITESTSDVISLHTFDLDAVYTYVSPSIKTLGGYEPEELIGKSCFDFIHPEDKKILLPLLQKYIRSKIKSLITRKKISVKETFEYRIKDKSGKWRYIQSTGNIVGDQFLFVSRDITKNKQAEESLRKSEEKYRNLVEKLEEGIVSIDENENFIFVNNATSKIFGYPKKEIIKKNLKDFTTPHEFKKIIEQTSVRKKGKSSKYEINIIKKDGSHGVISATASPIFDDNKKYTGAFGIIQDITERKKAEEKEKEHHKNIELLSETAMQFVEFPQDKNIYAFIGEQFQEFAGKDSYVAVNSIDTETKILTTRAVIGMGKLSKKVTGLLGKHPVGMTYDTKDKDLLYFSDGKLHLYKEGLYGLALKIIPKTVCNSIEKLLNIKKIYGIGFTKDNELFGTIAIFLKESAGELKNKQIIETFIKQASIAVQKRQAEEALITSNENFQEVVSNITTVVWKADIGKNGAFENTYTSPVVDELLELPAGTLKNDWNKYFSYIKPEYLERVNNAFREAIISPGKVINCEYEVLKDNGQTAWFHSHGRCFEKKGKLHVFGSTMDITERKRIESKLKQNENMLRQIIDTSPNCIFVKDRNGMYLVANKRMAELHSTTPEEFVGKYDYKVAQQWFETVDYNEFRKAEQNVIDNKKTLFINEEPFVYHDGTERWFQTTKISFELEDNKNCLLVISTDITERKQADEALREKAFLLDSSSAIIGTCDLDSRMTYANPTFLNQLGFDTVEEILGRSFKEFWMVQEQSEEIMTALMGDGGPGRWSGELKMKRKDGSLLYMHVSAVVVLDSSGKPSALMSTSIDITDRKKAEKELSMREAQYRGIFEASNDSFLILDLNGVIKEANSAACKMYDYSYEEIIGLSGKDIVHPDYHYMFKKFVEETTAGKAFSAESIDIGKDGSPFNIEIIGSAFKYKGEPHLLAVVRDITERKQAEEELRESEERFRRLFEDLGDAVFVTKIGEIDRGIIVEINPAAEKQTGYTRNELIGMNIIKDISINESGELSYDEWDEKLNKGEMVTTVEKKRKKDGTEYWTEVIVTSINFKGEKASLSINHDITERKKAEEQLKKKNTELEAFNKLTIGRELKMIELKKEINELLTKLGQEERYKIVE